MRNDHDRLFDILEAIERIHRHTAGGREDFEADELVQTWVVHHLQIIDEAASRLSDDATAATPEVPWRAIVGMRNILVHGYFHIDLDAVWTVVERDLGPLESAVRRYVGDEPQEAQALPSSEPEADAADHFHREMVAGIDRLNREINYRATRFAQMVNEYGGVAAAKRLLTSDQYSEGFTTLWERGRLDMSVEAFVLLPWYRHLFTTEERTTAERRLSDHDFHVQRFLQQRAAECRVAEASCGRRAGPGWCLARSSPNATTSSNTAVAAVTRADGHRASMSPPTATATSVERGTRL